MKLVIIAAVSLNNAIGIDGKLPWHLSNDLQHFKKETSNYSLIMGRNTWESLPFILPGRNHLVVSSLLPKSSMLLSSDKQLSFLSSLQSALKMCCKEEKVFVIGGEKLYEEAMQYADILDITHVLTPIYGATAFFPYIDGRVWRPISSKPVKSADMENSYDTKQITYVRSN